jgi:predicted metalloprotease with PDZ domain
MKKTLTASAATFLALALAIPAFAGGDHCAGASAATADAHGCCAGKNMSTAWGGAWLHRSPSGTVTVADVAKGSPAARSGLKTGDIVLAVNGHDLSKCADHAAMCAAKGASASASACNVGSAVTYTVQRGRSTKSVKFNLEKMPANATERYPSHLGTFDPMLAAVVMTSTD